MTDASKTSTPSRSATPEMADAARGVMQLLRGKHGATMTDLYEHCRARGDDVRKWPQWALDYAGYVTEEAAAILVYELMEAQRAPRSETQRRIGVYDPATGKCRDECDCSIGETCRAYLIYKEKK